MTTCPSCGSNRIHRSRSRNFYERLRRQFSTKRLFRCDACGWRGWGIELERPEPREEEQKPPKVPPPDLEALDRELH
jgi:predicted RNA-binding Zn-ribbon protein involved in translation (DUF1610 family)